MRAVIQKVTHAEVDVISADSHETCGRVDSGFVVLLGVIYRDMETDVKYVADKTANLWIFKDETGKLNLSLKDTSGTVLLVSQPTLHVDACSGRRSSCSNAAPAAQVDELYRLVTDLLRTHGLHIETGRFQTHMQINLCNDGPVTLLLDSQELFRFYSNKF